MAHELMENDGAVFNRQAAWHGIGETITEDMTPFQALHLAKLNWNVVKSPMIYTQLPNCTEPVFSTDYAAIVREDTNEILSVQSPDYEIIQNAEHFEMAYSISDDVKVESALSLKNGRKVILLLRGETFNASNVSMTDGDPVTQYLALINSHDGSLAFCALPTSIRIVCNNTLSMALQASRGKNMYRITHKGTTMEDKMQAMRTALGKFKETGSFFQEKVQAMAATALTSDQIKSFWIDMYGMLESPVVANPTTDAESENYKKALVTIGSWAETFDAERKETKGEASLWLAANAVTKGLQFKVASRGRKTTQANRVWDNLSGNAQDDTLKVFKQALQLV